jgi:hypothetical protein
MIRPFTCICLMMAAGSGLYLYQVKQRAFALDSELRSTFHDIDAARDRTRMLKADWALMNDPERLQSLATQYLTLQPMGPSQLLTMDQLAAALPQAGAPAPAAPDATPDATQGVPMALATPTILPHTSPLPQIASLEPPVAPAPVDAAPDVAAADPAPTADPTTAPLPPPALTPSALPPPALPPLAAAQAVATPALPPLAVAQNAPAPNHPRPVKRQPRATTPTLPSRAWLASAGGATPPLADAVATRRTAMARSHHHVAPAAAPVQLYAANDARQTTPTRYVPMQRITPPAATVMYNPASGSSLGMAAADMAPPRPLYSNSQ